MLDRPRGFDDAQHEYDNAEPEYFNDPEGCEHYDTHRVKGGQWECRSCGALLDEC